MSARGPHDVVAQLAAIPRTPRHALDDLAAAGRELAKHDWPLPEVELVLIGGHVVRGRLASIGEDGGVAMAFVVTGGQPSAPSVAYVRVDQIAAVAIPDASVFARSAAPAEPAPSKLELARALGARAESLTTALGRALPLTTVPELDEDGRRAVAAMLPALVDTLRAIAREATGKQALDALSGIELAAAVQPAIRREAAKLVVIAARFPAEPWPAARLRAELEKQL